MHVAIRAITATLIVGFTPSVSLAAATAGITADEVLQRLAVQQAALNQFSSHVDIELKHVTERPRPIEAEIYASDLDVDGPRTNVSVTTWEVEQGQKKPAQHLRQIWDGEQYFLRQQQLGQGLRQDLVSVSREARAAERIWYKTIAVPFLHGRAMGDNLPMVTILQNSQQAKVAPRLEDVDGASCHVLTADTDYGRYTLWLDPKHGSQLRRARVEKRKGNIAYGEKLPVNLGRSVLTGIDCEIKDVQVEQINGTFVLMAATMECVELLEKGKVHTVQVAKRSRLELSPDFSNKRAFVLDGVPNGTPVWLMNSGDSIPRAWRDGKVVTMSEEDVTRRIDQSVDDQRREAGQDDAALKPR